MGLMKKVDLNKIVEPWHIAAAYWGLRHGYPTNHIKHPIFVVEDAINRGHVDPERISSLLERAKSLRERTYNRAPTPENVSAKAAFDITLLYMKELERALENNNKDAAHRNAVSVLTAYIAFLESLDERR